MSAAISFREAMARADIPGARSEHARAFGAIEQAVPRCNRILSELGLCGAACNKLTSMAAELTSRTFDLCESPIESVMMTELVFADWRPFGTIPAQLHVLGEPCPPGDVLVIPQFPIGFFRLDFLVVCRSETAQRWVCVECDGDEFHNTSKAKWDSDRARDAWLKAFGIETHRFTGAQIWKDCAAHVHEVVAPMTAWLKDTSS